MNAQKRTKSNDNWHPVMIILNSSLVNGEIHQGLESNPFCRVRGKFIWKQGLLRTAEAAEYTRFSIYKKPKTEPRDFLVERIFMKLFSFAFLTDSVLSRKVFASSPQPLRFEITHLY